MTSKHLTTEQLSDFIDEILSEEEKIFVLEHIKSCEICRCELYALQRCISLLSQLHNECFEFPDLCEKTLSICKARHRRKMYIKSIPAIAASMMIIATATAVKSGFDPQNRAYVQTLSAQNDVQSIINAIRDSKGRIVNITSNYIDGEIDHRYLETIKSFMESQKIKHEIIQMEYAIQGNSGRLTNTSLSGSNYNEKLVQLYRNKDRDKIMIRFFK
ncbi:MAG TPA: zf-HC2 domain-containing protein [Spirochaetota bacterium]|jgi:hypothetical protein|nr:zf-HC2 domain-containing protein [Spirochaetota bacterium]OQA96786.1 MAG: hypothetical protein BWY23_01858 [Spirochaetes bacterium ADurb.Bin218]HOK01527.1 zf-HC2 domain-containing protein [Spirochaetota bacterium]HOK92574.1 zf-HC2 domain-containing protein [Spirochaetota bacterium]HON15511.1 zf-HC2 domain-containing protein [Spirochaetota bacterium]